MHIRRFLSAVLTGAVCATGATTAIVAASSTPAGATVATRLVSPNAAPTTLAVTTAGDAILVKFQGVTSQVISVAATSGTFASNCDATITLRTPSSVVQGSPVCAGQAGAITNVTLPASGQWQVLFDPAGSFTGSISFVITSTGTKHTITANAPAVDVAVAAGTNFDLQFGGAVGKFVAATSTGGTGCGNIMTLLSPTLLTMSSTCPSSTPDFIDQQPVTVSGLHRLRLTNTNATTQHFIVRVFLDSDVALSTTIDGPSQRPAVTRIAQNMELTFPATAGQSVHLAVGSPTFAQVVVRLRAPDGGVVTVDTFTPGRAVFSTLDHKLEMTGTWTYFLDPVDATTGTATLQVVTVPDPTMLQVDGVARRTQFSSPGDGTVWPFDAIAGQHIAIKFTQPQLACSPGTSCVFGNVLPPSSPTPAASLSAGATPTSFGEVFITTSGRWTITLTGATAGSIDIQLISVNDVIDTIQYGVTKNVGISTPVQRARLALSASSGDRVSMLLSNYATTTNLVTVSWIRPNGTTLVTQSTLSVAQAFSDPRTLDATGTWTIEVDLPGGDVGTVSLLLTRVTDINTTITVDGAAKALTLSQPGQVARLSFNRSALARFRVRTAASTFSALPITVRGPLGTVQTCTVTVAAPTCSLASASLSGTYTIVVNPTGAQTGSVSVSVTSS